MITAASGRQARVPCPLDRLTPLGIDVAFLKQFDEFLAFQNMSKESAHAGEEDTVEEEDATPEESLEHAYQRLWQELAEQVLEQVKSCSPEFFEHLVVEMLVAMGYGGSRRDAGETVGRSGDGGIDGIIKEDRLGLDVIYIQAKRWDNTVGRPEIQRFVGALQGKRARKGIFITTSNFSREARDYAVNLDSKVILMDGQQLAQFMADFDVGVSKVASYDVKRVDTDYFTEE